MSDRTYKDWTVYGRILGEARPYWWHLLGVFVLGLLATPLALVAPVPLKIAVDNVVGNKPLPGWLDAILPASLASSKNALLVICVTVLILVALLTQLQTLASVFLSTYTGEKLLFSFRNRLFRHIQRLSLRYHDSQGTPDSTYRIQYDAMSVQTIAVNGVIPFVTSLVMVGAMLYVTAQIDTSLAVVALVITPAMLFLTLAYRRRLRERYREVKVLESSAMTVVQEVLSAVRLVKAFGQEDQEEDRFAGRSRLGMRARVRVALVDGAYELLLEVVVALGTAAVLYVGIRGVESGSITLGSLLLVMGYLAQLYAPLSTISRRVTSLQSGFASAERVFTVLDEAPDVPERPAARPLARARGSVKFQNVWFSYQPGQPVLRGVSFDIEPGDRVGIAGRTGAGKTTLANLVTRFYDPEEGAILLDGVDLRDYKLADLRDQFGIVLQEPVLFSTTIIENIAYARPGASGGRIVEAARAANAHNFIRALPHGYYTVVGERGMTLSGGERQRISLARAFLKDAPILILDEPTSSVDVKTEAAIMEAMVRLMEGRTAFMIAHRLSTLDMCNVRLELEDGRVQVSSEHDVQPPRHQSRTGAWWSPSGPLEIDPSDGAGELGKSDHVKAENNGVQLARHPAVLAWQRFLDGSPDNRGSRSVVGVGILEESKATDVYRLQLGDDEGQRIVAKHQQSGRILWEKTLDELMRQLGMSSTESIGMAPSCEPGRLWGFFADAGEGRFSFDDEEHSALAASWLADLHVRSSTIQLSEIHELRLDDFESNLDTALDRIEPAVKRDECSSGARRARLRTVRESLLEVRANWQLIEREWNSSPRAVIHGDFAPKNLRVGNREGGSVLLPFDWEMAGIGSPLVDLWWMALPGRAGAVDVYLRSVTPAWRGLTTQRVLRLACAGLVLRMIDSILWGTWALEPSRGPEAGLDFKLAEWLRCSGSLSTAMLRLREPA